ncbi:hypothetical protein V8C86DRAFT_936644 [Haematococcus lacustris]
MCGRGKAKCDPCDLCDVVGLVMRCDLELQHWRCGAAGKGSSQGDRLGQLHYGQARQQQGPGQGPGQGEGQGEAGGRKGQGRLKHQHTMELRGAVKQEAWQSTQQQQQQQQEEQQGQQQEQQQQQQQQQQQGEQEEQQGQQQGGQQQPLSSTAAAGYPRALGPPQLPLPSAAPSLPGAACPPSCAVHQLLHPLPWPQFLSQHWERQPLHLSRGQAGGKEAGQQLGQGQEAGQQLRQGQGPVPGQPDSPSEPLRAQLGATEQATARQAQRSARPTAIPPPTPPTPAAGAHLPLCHPLPRPPGPAPGPAPPTLSRLHRAPGLAALTSTGCGQDLAGLLADATHLPPQEGWETLALDQLRRWWATPPGGGADQGGPGRGLPGLHPMQHGADIRLVVTLPGGATSHLKQAGEAVRLEDCMEAFKSGATIALKAVGSRCQTVHTLQQALGEALGLSPGANLYLSPPGAQGLGAHFDDHCVLVVQLMGRKRWLLLPPQASLPPPSHVLKAIEAQPPAAAPAAVPTADTPAAAAAEVEAAGAAADVGSAATGATAKNPATTAAAAAPAAAERSAAAGSLTAAAAAAAEGYATCRSRERGIDASRHGPLLPLTYMHASTSTSPLQL